MAAITWKNINTPSFVDSVAAQRGGAASLDKAFGQFTGAADTFSQGNADIFNRATKDNTDAGILAAQSFTNPDTFEADKAAYITSLGEDPNIDKGQLAAAFQNQQTFNSDTLNNALDRQTKQFTVDNQEELHKLSVQGIEQDLATGKLTREQLQQEIDGYDDTFNLEKRKADSMIKFRDAQIAGMNKSQTTLDQYNKDYDAYYAVYDELRSKLKPGEDIDQEELRVKSGVKRNFSAIHADNRDNILQVANNAATKTATADRIRKDSAYNEKEFNTFVEGIPDTSFPVIGRSHADQKLDVKSWLAANSGKGILRSDLFGIMSAANYDIGQADIAIEDLNLQADKADRSNAPTDTAAQDLTAIAGLGGNPIGNGSVLANTSIDINALGDDLIAAEQAAITAPKDTPKEVKEIIEDTTLSLQDRRRKAESELIDKHLINFNKIIDKYVTQTRKNTR